MLFCSVSVAEEGEVAESAEKEREKSQPERGERGNDCNCSSTVSSRTVHLFG